MGEKDITEKLLEDYNDVFSDIMNAFLFDGNDVVKESSLENTQTHSQYKAHDGKIHELERDIIKYWKEGNVRLALYGIENQTSADRLMPLRVIAYDGASYKSQLTSGNKKVIPVITIVLYFGKEHWNAPITLKETLDIPERVDNYVNDYRIHVFEISWLTNEQINLFKSDFRAVADFFVKRRVDPDYTPKDKTEIKHIEEVLKLMSAFTGDNRYEAVLTYPDIKEAKSMCEVFDRVWNGGLEEGKAEGIAEGKAITLYSLVQDGDLSLEKASLKMDVSVQEFERLMNEAGYKVPSLS